LRAAAPVTQEGGEGREAVAALEAQLMAARAELDRLQEEAASAASRYSHQVSELQADLARVQEEAEAAAGEHAQALAKVRRNSS
jgi:hypothetical protein